MHECREADRSASSLLMEHSVELGSYEQTAHPGSMAHLHDRVYSSPHVPHNQNLVQVG